MPREPLCEEEIAGGAVDVRDRRVPERVKGVEPPKSGDGLPGAEDDLDATPGDPAAALVAEERRGRVEILPPAELVRPEAFELPD